jgi:alpha-D-xyloside xylohydrolase
MRLALMLFLLSSLQNPQYEKSDNGVIVRLQKRADTDPQLVRLEFVTENIVHVSATAESKFANTESLIIEEKPRQRVEWSLEEMGPEVQLSTNRMAARISLNTGEITFFDNNGLARLSELKGGGKIFRVAKLDAEPIYQIQQVFESPNGEAFFGLGQFQNAVMNYKTHNVELAQGNTVAVNPMLVSNRNYGILWDNYSLTRFGDPRPYEHLNTMKLFTEDSNPGGLTARYFSKVDRSEVFAEQVEPAINYEFREHMANWPAGFPVEGGLIEWRGFIASDFDGVHKFLLSSSSYVKVWLDGVLVADNWRQVWLPGTNHLDLKMAKGKKYEIKIEWIPDGFGDGPYMAFKWLSPLDERDQKNLSLFSEAADEIDYYYIHGENLDDVIKGYRELTGKATLLPKWAMGLFQSRERYQSQAELLEVVQEFRKRNLPLDVIVLDWRYWKEGQWGSHEFDETRFPDADGMIRDLHEKYDTRIMISVWPKFYRGTENANRFYEKGWLYKTNLETNTPDWLGHVYTFYDAFHPEAQKMFWDQINQQLFKKGIDSWWLDATEPEIVSNYSFAEKAMRVSPTALGHGAKYINAYSLLNSEAVYRGQREASPDQRVFILTRSAFAGQQRFASATWSGDVAARWDDLKNQISGGLNFSLAGIPYWTTDIGGFAVERRIAETNGDDEEWRELMTRWFQFGAFCPLFRVHDQYPYREIYHVAPEDHPAYQTMAQFLTLRYRLMPYIYSLAGQTYHDDYTIMRALVMDFPHDERVLSIGEQFMFGPALMVSPVFEYQARTREVYLPANKGWYDAFSGKYFEGGQTLQVDAPLNRIPLFVKAGSILPIGPEIQFAMEKPSGPITLLVYTGADAEFVIYEDEGVNYNYEKRLFSQIPIAYNDTAKILTVGERRGEFPGMLNKRPFRVVIVSKDRPGSLFDYDRAADRIIEYDGRSVNVTLN